MSCTNGNFVLKPHHRWTRFHAGTTRDIQGIPILDVQSNVSSICGLKIKLHPFLPYLSCLKSDFYQQQDSILYQQHSRFTRLVSRKSHLKPRALLLTADRGAGRGAGRLLIPNNFTAILNVSLTVYVNILNSKLSSSALTQILEHSFTYLTL